MIKKKFQDKSKRWKQMKIYWAIWHDDLRYKFDGKLSLDKKSLYYNLTTETV